MNATDTHKLVRADELETGDIVPGIATTRHRVVRVAKGRHLLRGEVVVLTTREILGEQYGPETISHFNFFERVWVEKH